MYKINCFKTVKHYLPFIIVFLIFSVIFFFAFDIAEGPQANFNPNYNIGIVFARYVFPGICLVVYLVFVIKIIKMVYKLKSLSRNGILIRDLEYDVVNSNLTVNNVTRPALSISYNVNGEDVTFVSGPMKEIELISDYADLLYYPNDLKNYYIDFNIETK